MDPLQFCLRVFDASKAQGLRLPVLDSNNPLGTLRGLSTDDPFTPEKSGINAVILAM